MTVVLLASSLLLLAQDTPPAASEAVAAPTVNAAPAPLTRLASITTAPPADEERKPALDAAFQAAIPGVEACYAAQRERTAGAEGDLLVQLGLGKKGEQLQLVVMSAGVLDDGLRGCAREAVSKALAGAVLGLRKTQVSVSYELRLPKATAAN